MLFFLCVFKWKWKGFVGENIGKSHSRDHSFQIIKLPDNVECRGVENFFFSFVKWIAFVTNRIVMDEWWSNFLLNMQVYLYYNKAKTFSMSNADVIFAMATNWLINFVFTAIFSTLDISQFQFFTSSNRRKNILSNSVCSKTESWFTNFY